MNKKILVEVARSFSYKLNLGNYESRDFFCSQKAEVPLEEAESIAGKLYEFCKKEVIKSVVQYLKEMREIYGSHELPKELSVREARERMWPGYHKLVEKEVTKEEQDEFDRKEAKAHNLMDAKRGD